jgi:hypothetical protein
MIRTLRAGASRNANSITQMVNWLRSDCRKLKVLVVSSRKEPKIYKIKDSYRQQFYVAVITLDQWRNSWGWKGHIDFDAGIHTLSTNRSFATAEEAKDHMRQSTHQCIDNRLG